MKLMTTSESGLQLIKDFEGCELKAYKCPAGVYTIGYGHTKGVAKGMTITKEKAEAYLKEDIQPIEAALNKLGINMRQEQFDALVSWCFNLGLGNFGKSTMRKYIVANKADMTITDEMVKWVNAGGRPLTGLKKRRVAEANLWLGREAYEIKEGRVVKRL